MREIVHKILNPIAFILFTTISFDCFSQTKTVMIDEAHHNLHTMTGSYAGFADLLRQNGYSVKANTELFTSKYFEKADVLVIANPLPGHRDSLAKQVQAIRERFRWSALAARSAFSPEEIEALRDWVFKGGSVFLILDHAPYGEIGGQLAAAFGV